MPGWRGRRRVVRHHCGLYLAGGRETNVCVSVLFHPHLRRFVVADSLQMAVTSACKSAVCLLRVDVLDSPAETHQGRFPNLESVQ